MATRVNCINLDTCEAGGQIGPQGCLKWYFKIVIGIHLYNKYCNMYD